MTLPLIAAAVSGLVIAADSGSPDLQPYATFAQFGIVGVALWAFFTGKVVSAKHYDEMKADRDKARDELASIRQKLDEQIIPALTRSTDLMGRLAERETYREQERRTAG